MPHPSARDRADRRSAPSLVGGVADDVANDILGEAAAREEPPGLRAVGSARALERAARPRGLGLAVARGVDRREDDRFGEPAGLEIRRDLEAAGATLAELARPLVRELLVADVA